MPDNVHARVIAPLLQRALAAVCLAPILAALQGLTQRRSLARLGADPSLYLKHLQRLYATPFWARAVATALVLILLVLVIEALAHVIRRVSAAPGGAA
jgi:ABC-type phosphate transport system permease subunit